MSIRNQILMYIIVACFVYKNNHNPSTDMNSNGRKERLVLYRIIIKVAARSLMFCYSFAIYNNQRNIVLYIIFFMSSLD